MALPATLIHSFHPNHQLSLVTSKRQEWPPYFICDACNQCGKSTEQFYMCEPCDFTIHAHCATAPTVLEHSLFVGSKFTLIENQTTTKSRYMSCQACGGETVGFRYYNREPYMYLHPCCAAVLPTRVLQDDRVFQLLKDSSAKCGICKDKSESSLSYRTSYDDGEHLYLHVSCLVKQHNNLTGNVNWVASAPIAPGVLGSFTRASPSITSVAASSSSSYSYSSSSSSSSLSSSTGEGFVKAAKVSFSVVRLVAHVATFDFGGAIEAVQDIAEEFE